MSNLARGTDLWWQHAMQNTCFFSATILVLSFAGAVSLGAQATHYRIVNLGNLSGTSGTGNTLNNIGWATGSADLAGNATEHATVWIYGIKSDLGTLGGPNSDVQWPVKNDNGLVAGWSETAAQNQLNESWSCTAFNPTGTPTGHVCVGFVWQWGVMTALPTLGGYNGFAAGANNRGQIAGWAETTYRDPTCDNKKNQFLQFEPVVYGPGSGEIHQLPNFPGDPDGAATAINDEGDVVGISGTCDVAVGALSARHALLWHDGKVTDLGSFGGKGWNTPMAINNRGDVVGFSDFAGDLSGGVLTPNFHAFLWNRETGRMTDIGVLPGDNLSEALDINDRGQVVGISIPSLHAFIYENGRLRDLNKLIPSNSPLMLLEGGGINNRGQITGQACVIADGSCPAGNDTPAYLAIPIDRDDDLEADTSDAEDDNEETPKIVVSDGVRQQMLKRLAFGHFEPEAVQQTK